MSLAIPQDALVCLENVADPRVSRRKLHKLSDILVVALCGFIAGCEGWVDVELFGLSNLRWFEKFLELPNGIPSHDTFGRIFALLDPQQLARVLRRFVQTVVSSQPGETIAIDGKTLRRSGESTTGQEALHLVSAWATERGVVLGQVATGNHDEIAAASELLQLLNVRGATITIDALGCQKTIAQQVHEQGADYVLAVKGNQKNLKEAIDFYMGPGHANVPRSKLTTNETNHGRTEQRTYTAMAAPKVVRSEWPDAQSIVRVCRETVDGQGKKTKEVRNFISSLPANVKRLASAIRGHWGIENTLHWSLDVTFNEDQSRIRQGYAAENAALLRRLALSILKQDTRYSNSLRCKRLRAGWEKGALEHFMAIFAAN
jgi:predicted transposase YbfD/YdcC